jgi:hypothetical protein
MNMPKWFWTMTVAVGCSLSMVSMAVAAPENANQLLKQKPPGTGPKKAPVLVSCELKLTVQARLSDSYLKSLKGKYSPPTATSTNFNDVVLDIYDSRQRDANTVVCSYKSKNGDIPNIVYAFPCPGAAREVSAGPHAFWCTYK